MTRAVRGSLIVVAVLLFGVATDARVVALESLGAWPRFSAAFPGDARGCDWTIEAGLASCIVVSERDGRTSISLVRLVDERPLVTVRTIDAGPYRVGSGRVFATDGLVYVALSFWGEESLIRIFVRDDLFEDGAAAPVPVAEVRIPRLLREADWRIATRLAEPYLIVATGGTITARRLLSRDGTLRTEAAETLVESARTVALPVVVAGEPSSLAWLEFADNGTTWLEVGVFTGGVESTVVRRIASQRIGFTTPFDQIASAGLAFLGRGGTWESRRSLVATVSNGELLAATTAVVRRRTQLSEFTVQPTLVRVDLSAGRATVEPLDAERSGVVPGSYSFSIGEPTLVAWLTESSGGEFGSSRVFVRAVDASSANDVHELVRTPRRLYSLVILPGRPLRAVWLQRDEEREAFQAGTRTAGTSPALAAGIVWHGSVSESVAAGAIGLLLTPVAAAYWGIVGNAVLVAAIALAAVIAFRVAAAEARRHSRLTAGLAVVVAVCLAGDPYVAFAGPNPGIPVRIAVAALLLAVIALRGATADRVGQPSDIARWGIRATVLTIAAAAYPAVMMLLA